MDEAMTFPPPAAALGAVRDEVHVRGVDALTYVHGQLSQDLRGLGDGDRAWSLLLEPTGKVVAVVRVTRVDGGHVVLDTDPGYGEVVAARLRRFLIRVRAEIEVRGASRPTDRDDALRIAAGWPAMGVEVIPGETLPAALGLNEQLVSFTKGCYPGQELVERMDARRAAAPRTLARVTVAAGTARGDEIVLDDGRRATVTSVAGTDALAMVDRA